MNTLVTDNLPLLAGAPNGIKKLRELILELAVRGKLVPQDPNDEPASELLKRIAAEKARLVAEGTIKKQKPLAEIREEDRPFEVPTSWAYARLSEIATKLTDGSHNPPKDAGSGFPMLSSRDVTAGSIRFDNPSRYLSIDDFNVEDLRTRTQPGDVLLTIVASLGRAAVIPINAPKFALQRSVAVIASGLYPHFLSNLLNSPVSLRYFDAHAKGTAQKGIYLGKLGEYVISVPPLAEQHRIVAKVDELMVLCDRLEAQQADAESAHAQLVQALLGSLTQSADAEDFSANWQRLAEHFHTLFTTEASIDALKQALLQLALMGKLVPQDPNDEPASELLKRISENRSDRREKKQRPIADSSQVEKPFELPANWAWATLPAVGELARGKSRHRPRNDPSLYTGGNVPLIQTGDVARANGTVNTYSTMYNAKGVEQSRLWPAGTMCITIAANIADSALLGFDACFPDSVVGFIPDLPELNVRYFEFFLRTAKSHLEDFAPSTAQKNINLEILGLLSIPLPPATEMQRIVAKVDQLMTLCDQLKARLTQARQLNEQLATTLVEQAVA